MKIVILDARKGQEITSEIEEKIDEAQVHLTIEMDNTVTTHIAEGAMLSLEDGGIVMNESDDVQTEYIQLPHRDELSGQKSATVYDKISAARTEADKAAEPALEKAKRALKPTPPSPVSTRSPFGI